MRATIFDFNGVLIDDEGVHLASFREILAPLGVEVTDAAYLERYLGFDDAGAIRAMLADAGRAAGDAEVARLVDAKKPVYMRRIATDLVVYEGAREILARRAALGTVAIVSGALRHEIDHALGVLGARDLVSFVVAAEDVSRCKPHPEGYLAAAARLGDAHARARAVVVEDSLAGVEAAKAAGLRCAAVAHAYDEARLRAAGADVVAPRLADLTDSLLDA